MGCAERGAAVYSIMSITGATFIEYGRDATLFDLLFSLQRRTA